MERQAGGAKEGLDRRQRQGKSIFKEGFVMMRVLRVKRALLAAAACVSALVLAAPATAGAVPLVRSRL